MTMSELKCIVVTPEATVRDGSAQYVAVTLYDGELGVAPGHTPMLGRLGYGEMRITGERGVERYYVEAGFVEVIDNSVTILTNRAIPAEDLDESTCQEQLDAARAKPSNTAELMGMRDLAVTQSRAQLLVAQRAS